MRRSTLILVLLALVAVGAYYLLTSRQQAEQPTDVIVTLEPTREVSYLFDATNGVPMGIRIVAKTGESVEVKRNAENAWELVVPVIASADQGSVEAAASQLSAIRVLDRVSGIDPDVLGLKSPEYRLFLTFSGDGVSRPPPAYCRSTAACSITARPAPEEMREAIMSRSPSAI